MPVKSETRDTMNLLAISNSNDKFRQIAVAKWCVEMGCQWKQPKIHAGNIRWSFLPKNDKWNHMECF
jgi:hypothetical protein